MRSKDKFRFTVEYKGRVISSGYWSFEPEIGDKISCQHSMYLITNIQMYRPDSGLIVVVRADEKGLT